MDFGFTDEQSAIKETAREMLAERSPLSAVREAAESRTYPDALWSEIRDLGWPGIAIDEEHGGQGLGLVELVILAEELGYACAPTPFLSNAIAGLVIDSAASDEQRDRWLPGIASGEERGARSPALETSPTGPGRRGRRRDRAGPDDGAAAGRGIGGEDRAGRADRRDARATRG